MAGTRLLFIIQWARFTVLVGRYFWAASDVGWVVGHSYIVYGPLIKGATTVLHEGKPIGTPDAGAFWRMIESHKVNVLFVAPTAFRAIQRTLMLSFYLNTIRRACVPYLWRVNV